MMADMELIKIAKTAMPMPNPYDWLTIAGAAFLLGVSRRTVERMLTAGTLSTFRPLSDAPGAGPVMLWRAEVNAMLDARLVAAVGPAAAAEAPNPCAAGCPDPAAHAEGAHDV